MNPKLDSALRDIKKGSKAVDSYVHERPWFMVAIIALLAWTFGFLVGRTSKD